MTTQLKLGRKARVLDSRTLLFSRYSAALPAPPPSADWTKGQTSFGVMDNDTLGCCVAEDSIIEAEMIKRVYRLPYSGPMLTLQFESGKHLTVTPNHAIFTPRGFVRAESLKKGDDCVGAIGREIFKRPFFTRSQFDFDEVPTTAHNVFSAASIIFNNGLRRVVPSSVDFHGDGEFVDSDIDVVDADGSLQMGSNSPLCEPESENNVGNTGQSKTLFHRGRARSKTAVASRLASLSDMGVVGDSHSLFLSHASVTQRGSLSHVSRRVAVADQDFLESPSSESMPSTDVVHVPASNVLVDGSSHISEFVSPSKVIALSTGSGLKASTLYPASDGVPTDSEFFANLHNAHPGLVHLERIKDILVGHLEKGHVYDFSTDSNFYSANGIITHNCTIAACGHAIQIWTANTSGEITVPDPVIENIYSWWAGYVPGNPSTDNGAIPVQILSSWRKHGFNGNKLKAFVSVDVTSPTQVQQSISFLGGNYVGLQVPNYVMDNLTAPGSTWDVDPSGDNGIAGGHAVWACGYRSDGTIIIISWGNIYYVTPSFWSANMDESYALLSPEWFTKDGPSASGFAFNSLWADLAQL